MMLIKKYIILFFLLFCLSLSCTPDKTQVSETDIVLKTYGFDDPDPIPYPYDIKYPYFSYEGYTAEGRDSVWNMVELENKYIKVSIMPEVGGKVWGAIEKQTGEEFLYYNHTAKFRNVGMRGPWTSGGIEFNFGILGHSPTTSNKVDYCTRENNDGSVSCFVGTLELLTHTWWQVEINLPKDKAYFTTKTTWHNPSPVVQAYYHWMNAAYVTTDDLEFYFPGQYHIGHEGDVHPWPLDEEGREIYKYKENNFGSAKSYHIFGDLSDYYAAYYHEKDFGSVHYAPYDEKIGMKIWIWGLARQGMIWEDLLTDNDGQYVELQSGRLYNQALYSSMFTPFQQFGFQPFATDTWMEYWYPVKGTNGITKANEFGAVSINKSADGKTGYISFCPVQPIQADLIVYADNKELYKKYLSLNPLNVWNDRFDFPSGINKENITIVLGDKLLEYNGEQHTNRPVKPLKGFDWHSVYGMYVLGIQEFNRKNTPNAESCFNVCLSKDSLYIPAITMMASIRYKQGRYAEALTFIQKSLSVNSYDPDANLIYAAINSRLEKNIDAKDGYSIASLSPSHRTAGYIGLAKEYAKDSNWRKVLHYAEKGLTYDTRNMDALLLKAVAFRKMGDTSKALELINDILESYPLNHFARYEKYKQTLSSKDKEGFISGITNELPHETYMEIGSWYEEINCQEEAVEIFLQAESPIPYYKAAYLLNTTGKKEESLLYLKKAEEFSPFLIFPHRSGTIPALEWAVQTSSSWKNKYYLSTLHRANNQPEKAFTLVEECKDIPDYAPFYLYRSQYKQSGDKLVDLMKAEAIDKSWRTGLAICRYYENDNQFEKAMDCMEDYRKTFPENQALSLNYASLLLNTSQYQKCFDFLNELTVLPSEWSEGGRNIYKNVCLFLALDKIKNKDFQTALSYIKESKKWPENLGVGEPYPENLNLWLENYMTYYCYIQLNEKDKAIPFLNNESEKKIKEILTE